MNGITIFFIAHAMALLVALGFPNLTLTEIYAATSFSVTIFLAIGLINMAAFVSKLDKGELNDNDGKA